MKKQRGGTLLGCILGALVGLGAALAVAVYITKVPIPFTNKTQARSPDSDATESTKNRDWDPNSGLGVKAPARTPAPPPEVAAARPAASAPTAAASAPRTAKAPPSVDALGDLARARSGAPTTVLSPGSVADPFTYFIQVGAFRTPEDAEQQRARILLMGLQARVTERDQSGRTVYRVRLGPFERKEDADKAKDKLDGNGIETALVRVQR